MSVAACGSSSGGGGGSSSTSGGSGQKAVRIAYFAPVLASPFNQAEVAAVKEQAEAMGASVNVFDAASDPQAQIRQCQNAIATQQYQAFLIEAVDGPSMIPCARDAHAKGISVVAMTVAIGTDPASMKPQVDGVAATLLQNPASYGGALASMTEKACAGKDPCNTIYLFGPAAFSFAAQTRKVFQEQVAKHPNIHVVAEGRTDLVPDKARSLMKQFLLAHPDVNVITDDDDATAVAILDTVKQAGLQDKVQVIGGGAAKEAVEQIKAGNMYGTATLAPESEAKRATEIAVAAARGEQIKGSTEIDVGVDLSPIGPETTKENVDGITPQWSIGG